METAVIEKAKPNRYHTVVYTDITDVRCAVMAMQGQTTKSIAQRLGISKHKAEYRIQKAQKALKSYFRADFRNGRGAFADMVLSSTYRAAEKVVKTEIAPKFIPFAVKRPN